MRAETSSPRELGTDREVMCNALNLQRQLTTESRQNLRSGRPPRPAGRNELAPRTRDRQGSDGPAQRRALCVGVRNPSSTRSRRHEPPPGTQSRGRSPEAEQPNPIKSGEEGHERSDSEPKRRGRRPTLLGSRFRRQRSPESTPSNLRPRSESPCRRVTKQSLEPTCAVRALVDACPSEAWNPHAQ